MENTRQIPKNGYSLPLWNLTRQYRITALAYMRRENVNQVSNEFDGSIYTLKEIQEAIIGGKKPSK